MTELLMNWHRRLILITFQLFNLLVNSILIINMFCHLLIRGKVCTNSPVNLLKKILFEVWMKDNAPLAHLLHKRKSIMCIVCFEVIFNKKCISITDANSLEFYF